MRPDRVAVRLDLEQIPNVQSSWVTQGLKTCQLGLRFGANDAGFIPKQRDTLYRTYFLD